jgi:hypothetical protein
MDISESNAWIVGSDSRTVNEVVIKTCIDCGHTQRLPYKKFVCPSCERVPLLFHPNVNHLIGYINRYGLGNLNIVDSDIREKILAAFE